jgi:hypothetical protein
MPRRCVPSVVNVFPLTWLIAGVGGAWLLQGFKSRQPSEALSEAQRGVVKALYVTSKSGLSMYRHTSLGARSTSRVILKCSVSSRATTGRFGSSKETMLEPGNVIKIGECSGEAK